MNVLPLTYSLHPILIDIFQKLNCSKMIAIFIIGMGVAINSTSYKKFPVKTLEDQQKVYVAFIRLISTLGALDHCIIWKYINQNWIERVLISVVKVLKNFTHFFLTKQALIAIAHTNSKYNYLLK